MIIMNTVILRITSKENEESNLNSITFLRFNSRNKKDYFTKIPPM